MKPAFVALILGLVFAEETSLSWLNASMLIQATPSLSAHSVCSPLGGSDIPRKIVITMLTLAGAATGKLRVFLAAVGVIGSIILLLANLGARTWHFLQWDPVQYNGPRTFFVAYLLAVATGFCLPHMSHRSMVIGGKCAMEYIFKSSVLVAIIFLLSDADEIKKYVWIGLQVWLLCWGEASCAK